jgi:hypothetical protein
MTTPDAWILITEVSSKLLELTGNVGPGYRRLSVLAADSKVAPPMEKRNGRWGLHASKLPDLAVALGLPLKTPVATHAPTPKRPSVPAETVQQTV